MRQISWRSEIDRPKVLKEARRCKLAWKFFPFRSSASEVRAKWPVDSRTLGHPCLTDAKSFASLQLVWTAGEPTTWRQNDRARKENRYAWTDEGQVDLRKSVLTFEAPNVLLVHRRSFGRTGEPVLSPSEFRFCRHWSVHIVGNVLSTTWLWSKIGLDNATDHLEIWDRPAQSSERSYTLPVGLKSFFSLLLQRQRSAGKMASRCTYTGASVFDRRQMFASPQLVWTGWRTYDLATERQSPKWKPLRMELTRVDCEKKGLTVQLQTARDGNRKAFSPSILRFLCPPTLRLGPRTQSLSIVRRSITLYVGTSCEEFTWLWSKISWDVWQISCEIGDCQRRGRQKLWKQLDAASWFESFSSLSLQRQQSAGKTARRYMYTGASVFDRRQKFCGSAARLDRLVNLR